VKPWGAATLILAAGCGGAIASSDVTTSNDDPPDAGAPLTNRYDGGFTKPPPPPVIDAGLHFTPVDTSQWRTDGTCSFNAVLLGTDTPLTVTGERVVAFIAGNEVPYLVFGCSADIGSGTVTFLGATNTEDGAVAPQWALLDWNGSSYWVDDAHISQCKLVETSTSFGSVGTPVSGSFSCGAMPTSNVVYANVESGTFSTILSNPVAFTIP
jgi:hypothetical protein